MAESLGGRNDQFQAASPGGTILLHSRLVPDCPQPSRIPFLLFRHIEVCHSDARRSLLVVFNGDYTAAQARIAVAHKPCLLGGHYHDGAELFFVVVGLAVFTVEAVDPPGTREQYTLRSGDMLRVPARVAHLAQVISGTILQTYTENRYTSAADYDHVYPPLRTIAQEGIEAASRLYRRETPKAERPCVG